MSADALKSVLKCRRLPDGTLRRDKQEILTFCEKRELASVYAAGGLGASGSDQTAIGYTTVAACEIIGRRGGYPPNTKEEDALLSSGRSGGWQRDACHRTRGLVERASKKREDFVEFGKQIKASVNAGKLLFAAAGDPKQLERGGRPYWLLRVASVPFKLQSKRKAWDDPKATVLPAKTLVVRAQW